MTRGAVLARIGLGAGIVLAPVVAAASEETGGTSALVYQTVNLVLVLGVIFYFARKPVLEYFATRRADIKRDLDTAAELLTAAEHRNAEIQRRLADLQSEIEEMRETSRRRADEECERILAEARKAAERIRADAHAAAEQELTRARHDLRVEAADLAVQLAGDLLRQNVGENDRERLLDEFITRVESSPGAAS